jgi:squalene cyclase
VLKANNQDLYNEQTMNDSTIKEMRSEMNQKGIKLVNQQESVMNQQNNYYTEQN